LADRFAAHAKQPDMLRRPAIAACLLLLASYPAAALDQVSLQLKWKHQFQFAGYYAALERGYYRDAGLDVEIREGGPDVDAMKAVEGGEADFGVCTTSILLEKLEAPRLVVLGVIFQHSPAVILVPSRARIGTLSDLKGRRLMDTPGSDDVAAMLKHNGIDYAGLPRVQHDGDPRDLIAGNADAMIAYSTNEPFVLDQYSVPYRTFSPRAFGFDFYGDNLCTSAAQAKAHPERTFAFLAASLRGWAYALSHKDEMVQLILNRYSRKKSYDALLFEAFQSEALIEPHLIELGNQSPQRWESIANSYRDLGMLNDARLPDGLIYQTGGNRVTAWLGLILPWLMLPIGSILLWLMYKTINRRLVLAVKKPKLSAIMAGLFVCLSIPALIFILAYSYHRNSETMLATLQEEAAKTRQASIENVDAMIRAVAGTLRLLAEITAADPGFFRTERSNEVLFQALTAAEEIDAAFVTFEDGYHRAVTRIDDDRRRSDPKTPPTANWHSNFVDDFSLGEDRRRHRTFFDTWGHVVGQYDVPTTVDYRSASGYPAAKESGSLVVAEPEINLDTGYPIINVWVPVVHNGELIGCAGVSITLDVLSRFLATHRASRHSTTIIADPSDGKVIAASEKEKRVRMTDGHLEVAQLQNINDDDVREAYRVQTQTNQDNLLFRSPRDGRELSASFARFPESFGRPWEAIVLTPTDDFVRELKTTNKEIAIIIVALSAVELFLMYVLSWRLSQPIEIISRDLKSVEDLSFDVPAGRTSRVREIAQLQSATSLLRNSLQSFSTFVPLDIVRQLIKSGIPLTLGVEPRILTVFFSDLENFSTHSETLGPDDLLVQISTYLEQVSGAISEEGGTVDKFIGDGVMAFWNAPVQRPDHVLRACAGALRAARRMERVNDAWEAEGRPRIRIRIGLNCATVLVGNVGSSTRLSYTAMGDGVNVAARLEGINKQFGTTICISDSIYDEVQAEILVRPLKRVQVKGRKTEFMIYELLAFRGSDDPELRVRDRDEQLSAMTWQASQLIEAGNFAAAACAYHALLDNFPDDPVAKFLLGECKEESKAVPPESITA
jgi:class 3 adenylate cyclase/ABC-type nitrate/sulfonate/bicarbonate transport system substrate-binding protein